MTATTVLADRAWKQTVTTAPGPVTRTVSQAAAPRVWALPHLAQASATARRAAGVTLTGWGMSEDAMAPALLVVSELVTNAVEHALPPVTLQLARPDEGTLHIEVTDSGPASQEGPWTASCGDDEHGRGRTIIAALVTAHGCYTPAGTCASTHWAALSTAD